MKLDRGGGVAEDFGDDRGRRELGEFVERAEAGGADADGVTQAVSDASWLEVAAGGVAGEDPVAVGMRGGLVVLRFSSEYRMAHSHDRDTLLMRLTTAVEQRSLLLSAPPLATTPARFRRPDGTSQFEPKFSAVYTSHAIVDAETRLLDAAVSMTAPRVDDTLLPQAPSTDADRQGVDEDQAAAVFAIASSGRVLDVLVGPAGSGKTTTLAALRAAWETQHDAGSVVGFAPTARAAEVLADALGVPTETPPSGSPSTPATPNDDSACQHLAHTPARRIGSRSKRAPQFANANVLREEIARWELHPGQLLIIDEASMCGPLALDQLTT